MIDADAHRALGSRLYNRTWELLGIADRTSDQDDELVDTAHASAWHWRQVGTAANQARAHWLLARVHATLQHGSVSLHHARRAVELVEAGGGGFRDWDAAAAAEAMARAFAANGDLPDARAWKARAIDLLAGIASPADREVIERQIASVPVDG